MIGSTTGEWILSEAENKGRLSVDYLAPYLFKELPFIIKIDFTEYLKSSNIYRFSFS